MYRNLIREEFDYPYLGAHQVVPYVNRGPSSPSALYLGLLFTYIVGCYTVTRVPKQLGLCA